MADVQAVEALYYPGSEFTSVRWVKAALLYWEGLLRIVPDGITPKDDDEVRELEAAGLIRKVSPGPYRAAAARTFEQQLAEILPGRDDMIIAPGSSNEDARLEAVHLTEIDESLAKDLQSRKLLAVSGTWARMPAELARLYHVTLGCVAGEELFVAPVTDHVLSDEASAYVVCRKRLALDPKTVPVNGLAWARLAVPFPGPDMVAGLSARRLIEIREKYARQRRVFRDLVQARATAIFALPSVEAIRSHLEDFAKEIHGELELQRHALHVTRVREAWSLLGISAPLSIGAGLATLGAPLLVATAGGIGSIGLGVVDWFLERDLSRRLDTHYLLALEASVNRFRFGMSAAAGGQPTGDQAAAHDG
jgi:hypothetical protein